MTDTAPVFPQSFPNESEELFLELLFCKQETFLPLWKKWKSKTIFDDIDYATLRLLPLLYLRLRKFGVHDEWEGKIKGVYRKVWFKNQLLLDAVARMLSVLKANKIPVITFKGIPLLIQAYKDPGARFLGDADILISPEHVPAAYSIMTDAGFTHYGLAFPLPQTDPIKALLMFDKEATFKDARENEIDVHWGLFEAPACLGSTRKELAMPYEDVFSRATPIRIREEECLTFSSEDLLLHVIVHGATFNQYRPIRWVVDAVHIIENMTIHWNILFDLILKYHFEVEARIAFLYLAHRGYVNLPQSFLTMLDSLVIDKKSLQRYYKVSDKQAMKFFGTFPLLWRVFWQFEAKRNLIADLCSFTAYIGKAYQIKTVFEFIHFILDKCKKRLKIIL